MPALVLKLLTLVALALMPLGMGPGSAALAQHAPVTAAAGHCDEPAGQPAEQSPRQTIDCAITCSMVATTADAAAGELNYHLQTPEAEPLAKRGTGLHPETATPPPRFS